MEKSVSYRDTDTTVNQEEATVFRPLFAWMIVLVSGLLGLMIAILWDPAIADGVIGNPIADTVVGSSAKVVPIDNVFFGVIFAIGAGLGATFTACNCVVFSCIAPLSAGKTQANLHIGRLLMWMSIGIIAVTATYGIIGVILGDQLPILSQAVVGNDFPVRLLQSTTIFVSLGVVLVFWGLIALQRVGNPFRNVVQQRPWLMPLFLGVLIGFFTVGRPFGLFRKIFDYSTGTGNAVIGALLIVLQGLSNVVVMALLFLLLLYGTGGRFERWLNRHPLRPATITAIAMIIGGTFFIAYWGLRLPARFGIGWFPHF